MINKDIFSIVFKYLSLKDRVTCLTVCREWFAAAAEFNEWTVMQFKECIKHNLLYFVRHTNIDRSADNNYAIQKASEYGHTSVVKLLLSDPRVDPTVDNNYAIQLASFGGRAGVVKLLLNDPRVDPSTNNNFAIRCASWAGKTEVVKLLLADSRVDSTANNNYAMRWAVKKNHIEVAKLLREKSQSFFSMLMRYLCYL